jgi:PPOX class probable F420-dependent enzyme
VVERGPALEFVRSRHQGVLVTLRRDGRPQLSNIAYHLGNDGVIRISVTADRAKTKNLARDPRASLYVSRDDFWAYVVIDGTAELSAVAAAPDDAAVDELVELYRSLQGEHPDWDEYRAAMVADRRLVVRLRPEHGYGMLPD